MWQRFTERVRRMVLHAREEAARRQKQEVSTDHLLLGMLREPEAVSTLILERLQVNRDALRAAIVARVGEGHGDPVDMSADEGPAPALTTRARRAIDLAYDEARQMGHDYIGSEHLLLGLLRAVAAPLTVAEAALGEIMPLARAQTESEGAAILIGQGVTVERVRAEVENPPLSMDEAARFLSISKPTLYRLMNQGDVQGFKAGRQWRFSKFELMRYLKRSPIAASAPSSVLDAELAFFGAQLQLAGSDLPAEEAGITDAGERKMAQLLNGIATLAIQQRASDIHLDPVRRQEGPSLRLRFRIDGVLEEIRRLPMSLQEAVVLAVRQWAGMERGDRSLPQTGRVVLPIGEREFELRIATIPSLHGEAMTVRILDRQGILVSFDTLRFGEDHRTAVQSWLHQPHGLILTTGPTGSGKTTTLYGMLGELKDSKAKILTVEDPIELTLPFATQVGVNQKAGLTFAGALRALMQHDPDILFIAELRDQESAKLALEFAMTGHLVLTQLSASTTGEAIVRLLELSSSPLPLGQTLVGVIAQRLARRICEQCRQPVGAPYPTTMLEKVRELAAAGGYPLPDPVQFQRGAGCDHCRQTGYRGRTAMYEVLSVSPPLNEAILKRASAAELTDLAVRDGMRTLFADGVRKAVAGETTLEEVIRVMNV